MHLDKFLSASELVVCLPRMTYSPSDSPMELWNAAFHGNSHKEYTLPTNRSGHFSKKMAEHPLWWSKTGVQDAIFPKIIVFPSFPSTVTASPRNDAGQRADGFGGFGRELLLKGRDPRKNKRKNAEISMEKWLETSFNGDEYTIIYYNWGKSNI